MILKSQIAVFRKILNFCFFRIYQICRNNILVTYRSVPDKELEFQMMFATSRLFINIITSRTAESFEKCVHIINIRNAVAVAHLINDLLVHFIISPRFLFLIGVKKQFFSVFISIYLVKQIQEPYSFFLYLVPSWIEYPGF